MTDDLHAVLAALGREERDGAPALPVDVLTARANRRRTLHAASYSAIGLGAAAVVTLGAFAADGLWLDRDAAPLPPATEEPRRTPTTTPTTTATPTTTPSPTPTEVAWQPSWELCGMSEEDLYARETAMDWATEDWATETGWWIESRWPVDTHTVPVDGLLTLILSVNAHNVAAVTVEAQLTEVVALEEDTTGAGWVAGVAASPTGDLVQGRVTGDDAISLGSIETRFVSCDASPLTGGDGALDTYLTGEHYAAFALTDIRPDGGDTVTSVSYVGLLGEYAEDVTPSNDTSATVREMNDAATTVPLGEPYRLAEGSEFVHTLEFGGYAIDELCGTSSTPMPPAWLETTGALNGWLGVAPEGTTSPFSVSATGFRDGGELIVQVTTTNNGPVVDDAWIASPGVTVVKDGQIIGYQYLWGTPFAPTTWPTGQTVALEFRLGQFTCTFMNGEPWPAGTYEVYVHQNMDVLAQPGYPEPWRYDVVGGPFSFTLD